MALAVILGGIALGAFLLVRHYAPPGCGADRTTAQLVNIVGAETHLSGLYLLNPKAVGGGLFSRSRDCVVDVAQIEPLQPLSAAHWLKVTYSARKDRQTGAVTVQAQVGGPVTPVFAKNPNT